MQAPQISVTSLRPTALVHEAYFRLIGSEPVEWRCRAHFFGVAAKAMRSILVDCARALVELRYFGSLSIEETAEVFGMSPATVKRHWSTAPAWLRRELTR